MQAYLSHYSLFAMFLQIVRKRDEKRKVSTEDSSWTWFAAILLIGALAIDLLSRKREDKRGSLRARRKSNS
jgi:aspartokinase-like uncharacterized kinase